MASSQINFSACTAERFFRIDRAQEQLHYVTDVAVEAVYVLEENATNQTSESDGAKMSARQEPETAQPSPRYSSSFVRSIGNSFFRSSSVEFCYDGLCHSMVYYISAVINIVLYLFVYCIIILKVVD